MALVMMTPQPEDFWSIKMEYERVELKWARERVYNHMVATLLYEIMVAEAEPPNTATVLRVDRR